MRHVIDYRVVEAVNSKLITDTVRQLIKDGWVPKGPARVSGSFIVQTMVLYGEKVE